MRKTDRFEAHLDDYQRITAFISREYYNGRSDTFYLRNADGTRHECAIFSYEQSGANYFKYTLGIDVELTIGQSYELLEEHGLAVPLQFSLIARTERFDEEFAYEGNDLGAIQWEDACVFSLWAPTASRVVLECDGKMIECTRTDRGVFRVSFEGDCHGKLYSYHINVNGKWHESIDPYARASTQNGRKSVVLDDTQIKEQKRYPLKQLTGPTDAVIYELSVRDMSMDPLSGIKAKGQYLGLCELNTETLNGTKTGLSHILELGVSHVQLMPVYDFETVDEYDPKLFYNWGYDPMQYNVPEGSYASELSDPFSRIEDLRAMVSVFHEYGIRVNMDVVYNHIFDMMRSSFEKTVPYYFFRISRSGSLSNGSFVGNDFDSQRKMARRYIVNSCRYWMEFYDMDGFRFDLMGILDVDTMNEIAKVCQTIKADVMIYGEGWNMPTTLDEEVKANRNNQAKMPDVGHFNDFFRDHVKGSTSVSQINHKGYLTGDVNFLEAMKSCLLGNSVIPGVQLFDKPEKSINYVECHDNHTLWDKMKESNKEDTREVRIERQKMMIGAVLCSQGVPFIHSGQEFCRTKNGIENSYRNVDSINQIDWSRKERYIDVYHYTRDLIKLRSQFKTLRLNDPEEIAKRVSFRNFDGMLVLEYDCVDEDPYEKLWMYLNPRHQIYYDKFDSFVKLIANESGLINDIKVQNAMINPYSLNVFAKERQR